MISGFCAEFSISVFFHTLVALLTPDSIFGAFTAFSVDFILANWTEVAQLVFAFVGVR